jgi:hypothetical protein
MTGQLQATHQEQLNEVPEMKTCGRGIESAVVGDRFTVERRTQRRLVGGNMDQTTPDDFFPETFERIVVVLLRENGLI